MTKAMDPRWKEFSWQQALSQATPAIARLLEKSLEGRELDFDDGLVLATVKGSDLLALVKVADETRRRKVGDRITYVVNRNLNFTNICIVVAVFRVGPRQRMPISIRPKRCWQRRAKQLVWVRPKSVSRAACRAI